MNCQQLHWTGRLSLLLRGNGYDTMIAHVICADTHKLENRKAILLPAGRVLYMRAAGKIYTALKVKAASLILGYKFSSFQKENREGCMNNYVDEDFSGLWQHICKDTLLLSF